MPETPAISPAPIFYDEINAAVYWWTAQHGADSGPPRTLLLFLIRPLDAPCLAASRLPRTYFSPANGMVLGGSYNLVIDTPPPELYVSLRASPACVSDVEAIAEVLLEKLSQSSLAPLLTELYTGTETFRVARNFITHLEERMGRPDKHGITGARSTLWGATYTPDSKGNVHFVLADESMHFTSKGLAESVRCNRQAFEESVFRHARPLLDELTSHRTQATTYPTAEERWPVLR